MTEFVTRVEWNGMMTAIDQRFDAMDRRFDAMDRRFDAMDQRFERLEERVRHQGVLHERLESKVDAVIENLETKASKTDLHEEISRLEVKIDLVLDVLRST